MTRPVKHSVTIEGRRTSVSLEPEFWDQMKRLAAAEQMSIGDFVQLTDLLRCNNSNLSSELRVVVLCKIIGERDAARAAAPLAA